MATRREAPGISWGRSRSARATVLYGWRRATRTTTSKSTGSGSSSICARLAGCRRRTRRDGRSRKSSSIRGWIGAPQEKRRAAGLHVPPQKIEHEAMALTACGQPADHHKRMWHILELMRFAGDADFLERRRE